MAVPLIFYLEMEKRSCNHSTTSKSVRLKWIDSMLDLIDGGEYGKEDAAEWYSYYFGKVYDSEFTVFLGITLVQWLDETNVAAMWCDANVINGCTLVAIADQGQGAWHFWIKIATMSGTQVQKRMSTDENFDPNDSYIYSQMAHIACKEDNPKILHEAVSNEFYMHDDMIIVLFSPSS